MTEYHEFIAIDRPLTAKQIAALRKISTRADISASRFWKEYHWGDLKADPVKLLERYFDAYLCFTDRGSRRLMLRLPRARVDVEALQAYFPGGATTPCMTVSRDYVVLDFSSDIEEPEYEEAHEASLGVLLQLRAEVLSGDMRCVYLAWLAAVLAGEIDDDVQEPLVPVGLAEPSAPQKALVELLRLDPDLLSVAAAVREPCVDPDALRGWVARMSPSQKDAWLLRAIDDPDLPLGGEVLRAFGMRHEPHATLPRRSVADLRNLAGAQRDKRMRPVVACDAKAKRTAEAARQRRLAQLAAMPNESWIKLEGLVATSAYEDALALAIDLRDLAEREGALDEFAARLFALRQRHSRRRGFFDRWKRHVGVPRADSQK